MNKAAVFRVLCGAVLVAMALYGCSVPGDSVASIQHSKGSYIYSNPGEGFSLKVPDSWVFISPASAELTATIDKVKQANPALAKSLETGPLKGQISNMADAGVKILAYDTASDVAATNFATNMNVVHMQVPSEYSTLEQVANENVNELKKAYGSMLTTEIDRSNTHVGAAKTPAVKISYSYRASMPDVGAIDASAVQYLLFVNNSEYVLTFTASMWEADAQSFTFDRIAGSMTLTK